MKSAGVTFANLFGITNVKPMKVETLLVSLLHTLSTHNLIDEAIRDITSLTELNQESREGLDYIKTVSKSPEFVALFNKPKSLRLLLVLLPHISIIEEYDIVTLDSKVLEDILNRSNKTHWYAELKKLLNHINELDLGYKVVQRPRTTEHNDFHVIKYKDPKEILTLLRKYNLQTPSVLDKIV